MQPLHGRWNTSMPCRATFSFREKFQNVWKRNANVAWSLCRTSEERMITGDKRSTWIEMKAQGESPSTSKHIHLNHLHHCQFLPSNPSKGEGNNSYLTHLLTLDIKPRSRNEGIWARRPSLWHLDDILSWSSMVFNYQSQYAQFLRLPSGELVQIQTTAIYLQLKELPNVHCPSREIPPFWVHALAAVANSAPHSSLVKVQQLHEVANTARIMVQDTPRTSPREKVHSSSKQSTDSKTYGLNLLWKGFLWSLIYSRKPSSLLWSSKFGFPNVCYTKALITMFIFKLIIKCSNFKQNTSFMVKLSHTLPLAEHPKMNHSVLLGSPSFCLDGSRWYKPQPNEIQAGSTIKSRQQVIRPVVTMDPSIVQKPAMNYSCHFAFCIHLQVQASSCIRPDCRRDNDIVSLVVTFVHKDR